MYYIVIQIKIISIKVINLKSPYIYIFYAFKVFVFFAKLDRTKAKGLEAMDTKLATTPLNYGPLIKQSLSLYKRSITHVFILSLLLSITVFIPRLLSLLIEQDIFMNLPPLSWQRLWMVAINIVSLVFFIGMLWRIHALMKNKDVPFIKDVLVGVKKVLLVFIAALLQSAILFAIALIMYGAQILLHQYNLLFSTHPLGIILTAFLFIGQFILLLYVATMFIFLFPLIAVENKSILASFEYSVSLAWNHWWRTFSVQITPWLCYLILLLIIRNVFHIDIHIYFMGYGTHTFPTTLLHLFLFALFIPWVAALLLTQLHDLELRKILSHKKNIKK